MPGSFQATSFLDLMKTMLMLRGIIPECQSHVPESPSTSIYPVAIFFKLEDLCLKSGTARGWGRFIGWKPFFYLYLSTVVKPEFANAMQPELIRNRRDISFNELKFHQNSRNPYGCECEYTDEYPDCRLIKESAQRDFIMRVLANK